MRRLFPFLFQQRGQPKKRQADPVRRLAAFGLAGGAAVSLLYLAAASSAGGWQHTAAFGAGLLVAGGGALAWALIRRDQSGPALWALAVSWGAAALLSSALLSGLGAGMGAGAAVLGFVLSRQAPPGRALPGIQLGSLAVGAACVLLDIVPPPFRLAPAPFLAPGLLLVGIVVAAGWAGRPRRSGGLSLRTKLTAAFLAVSLVPLGLLAYLNDRANRAALTSAANQTLLAAASRTAASVDGFISINQEVLRTEARYRPLADYLDLPPTQRAGSQTETDVYALLDDFRGKGQRTAAAQNQYMHLQSYWLLDSRGRVVAASPDTEAARDLGGESYFRSVWEAGVLFVSPVEFAGSGDGSLYFAAPVLSNLSGQPAGVLVARYSAGVLQSMVQEAGGLAGRDSYAALVDDNGMLLGHGQDASLTFKLAGTADTETVSRLQAAGRLPVRVGWQPVMGSRALADGLRAADQQPVFEVRDRGAALKPEQAAVVRAGAQPWQVAYFQPQEVYLAPAEAQSRLTALLALLIALALAAAAVLATQLLAGPITRLAAVTARISAGDLSARAPVESADEIGALAGSFNSMVQQLGDLYHQQAETVQTRNRQLAAAAEVGRAASSLLSMEELLHRALALIQERFGYDHASVYLLDDAGEHVVLRESTGGAGRMLKERGHRLAVGSNSLIGWVAAHHQPRVVSEIGADPLVLKNNLLLGTRAEAAVPLRVGERTIGALDVHSAEPDAFGAADVETLQILADQLAVAIENGRLFGRQQRIIELEQMVAGLSARIHQAASVESVLERAATDLGRALRASRAVVRLKGAAEPAPGGNGGSGQPQA